MISTLNHWNVEITTEEVPVEGHPHAIRIKARDATASYSLFFDQISALELLKELATQVGVSISIDQNLSKPKGSLTATANN